MVWLYASLEGDNEKFFVDKKWTETNWQKLLDKRFPVIEL